MSSSALATDNNERMTITINTSWYTDLFLKILSNRDICTLRGPNTRTERLVAVEIESVLLYQSDLNVHICYIMALAKPNLTS